MPASTHAVLPPLLLLLLLPPLLLLSLSSAASAALHPDALALLAFKAAADLDNRLRFSPNTSSSSSTPHHCSWPGVACSSSSPGITPRVTRLVLESQSLRGTLPPVALSRLDQLRILSLKNNSLSGPIPDLSALPDLKSLYLSSNAFSGPIPDTLTSLHRLRTLDLSSNNLSGPIPPSLTLLDRLADLLLDRNALQDLLPPFNQTSLRSFNVSGNNLSGPVPVTTALLSFSASAFADNPGLCGEVVRKECHHYGSFFKNGESNGQFGSSDQQADPTGRAKPGAGQLQGILANSSGGSPHDGGAGGWRRRKSVALGLTVAGGCALAAVLLCALLALRNTRRKGTRGLSPQKGALAAAEAADAALESLSYNNDHDDVGNNDDHSGLGIVVVHNSGAEMVAAATSVAEDKVKRLGKSGVLVFCAGEAPVYSLEQLMRASAELLGRGLAGTTYKAVLDNRLIVCVKRVDASKMSTTGKEAFEQHMEVVGRLRHPNIVPLRAYFQAKEERLLVYDYQPNGSLYSLIHGSKSSRAKPLHWTSCLKIAEDVAQGLAYIHQASRLVHGNLKATNVLLGSDFEACLTDNCLAFLFEPPEVEEEPGYRAPEVHNSNRNLTPKSDTYAFGVLLLELLTGKPPLQHSFLAATDLAAWVRSVRENEGAEDERLMMLVDIATECLSSSPESRPTMWQVLKMIQEVKEADMVENELD